MITLVHKRSHLYIFKEVTSMEAAITFKNVHYYAGNTHILENVNGSFPQGKITSLIGPSGAGKTTIFKLCNNLISPNNGKIYFLKHPLHSYDPITLRRQIGLALQDATMIKGTVFDNLALPLTLMGKTLTRDVAKKYLSFVGLEAKLLNRDAKDLSGGQRQKLSLARTLIHKPRILLLDEITSSLDKNSKQDIEQLILSINQTYETTIVWITHSIEQAKFVSDYTWVMIDGKLIETGDSHLLNGPQQKKVREFLQGEDK